MFLIRALAIPLTILFSAYFAHTLYLFQFGGWLNTVVWLPYLTLIVSLFFCLQFNQSRLALLSLALFIQLPWLPRYFSFLNVPDDLWQALSIVNISVSSLIIMFLKDRSLRHWISWLAVLVTIAPWGISLSLAYFQPLKLQALLFWQPLSNNWLSLLVCLLSLLVIVFNLVLLMWRKQAQDACYSAVIVTLWLAQHLQPNQQLQSLCFATAGIFILICVFQYSYRLAYQDELTGLPSRRALNQYASSLGRKYIVVMSDVDHFKKFNDTYGHDVGDQVLKLVASRLSKVMLGGRVYRYGGEEFTLLFSGKDETQVVAELERLRQDIANYDMVVRDKSRSNQSPKDRKSQKNDGKKVVNVTISLGYAKSSKALRRFDDCLKQADEALYRAKKAGRNCVSD
ncbi:GGDEF domain-containing protein [Catenovulum sediminis]|uniref:GGDEF domain-containing protein n=1 Tax=Catenovulum sediminis TaxID=1740262 RepID=UPI00117BE262|nr:GGDEF domain-containing protein [Catenovulum sediminis]